MRFPNVYGIDMPTRRELIAHNRDDAQICQAIGADELMYQAIDDMKRDVRGFNRRSLAWRLPALMGSTSPVMSVRLCWIV